MFTPKPEWLKVKAWGGVNASEVESLLKELSLNTVCDEAACPNRSECWGRRTATFMILGRNCTRNCSFCNVTKNAPTEVDSDEPFNVAKAVDKLDLKHVVVTSVTRDDLPDGGAFQFKRVIEEIRKLNKNIAVEVLIPDFAGDFNSLKTVMDAKPDILAHNVETVKRLYPEVRAMADYERSLEVLRNAKEINGDIYTKSGIMLGLSETEEEVLGVLRDIRNMGCDFLSIGQYLAPSKKHHTVVEYINPKVFDYYKEKALGMGYKFVAAGPLVRSSYHADAYRGVSNTPL